MKFWPLSVIASSPLVPSVFAQELRDFCYRIPSEGAYHAAKAVAQHTQPVHAPNMAIVESVGAPNRRVYTDYPEPAEWFKLERATVMEHNGYTFILMDALH